METDPPSLEELLRRLRSSPDSDFHSLLKHREQASGKILRAQEAVRASYERIESALKDVDPRQAYQEAQKTGRKLDIFLAEQVPRFRESILPQEAVAGIAQLRLVQQALNEKLTLFRDYTREIQVLYDAYHYGNKDAGEERKRLRERREESREKRKELGKIREELREKSEAELREIREKPEADKIRSLIDGSAPDPTAAAGNLPGADFPPIVLRIPPEPVRDERQKYVDEGRSSLAGQRIYFQRFVSFVDDDPLADALVILKQRGMYLPSAHLTAALDIALVHSLPKKGPEGLEGKGAANKPEQDPFSEDSFQADENYFFLTGTYCSLEDDFYFSHYLRQAPFSRVRINTSDAPAYHKNNDDFALSLKRSLWGIKTGVKAEKKELYQQVAGGRGLDAFHDLQYTLQQGMVVLRSRDERGKRVYDVATQDPSRMMARFFYGATEDQEKMVAYLLESSREIDARHGILTKELKI